MIISRTLPVHQVLTKLAGIAQRPDGQAVSVDADVSVRVFRPASARHPRPALLWIHGGGMLLGAAAQDSRFCRRIADQLDIVVASVEYRLAPEHPFPTPLEDCYTVLRWLARQPDIDPARIAITIASAGAREGAQPSRSDGRDATALPRSDGPAALRWPPGAGPPHCLGPGGR